MTTTTRERLVNEWCAAKGYERLSDSAYGPHAFQVTARVPGRKTGLLVTVTTVSYFAAKGRTVQLRTDGYDVI